MLIAGIILLLVAYYVDLPGPLDTIAWILGWILFLIGLVFLVLYLINRPVGGRRRLYL